MSKFSDFARKLTSSVGGDSSAPLILFLSGANLGIMQFVATRNLSSAFFGTEVVLFLVTAAYFLGYSAGYFISDRLDPRSLRLFALAQWATHLTFPFSWRWLGGVMGDSNHNTAMFFLLLFLGSFWSSSFYSVLLPRLLSRSRHADVEDFCRGYGLEILGAMAGFMLIGAVSLTAPAYLMVFYQANFVLLLYCLFLKDRRILALGIALAALYAVLLPGLDRASVARLYESHGYEIDTILFSADTPYQRVEIFENGEGVRQLYLDGIRHYGSDSLGEFNYFIAGLPVSLLKAPEVIVVGSGSFEAVAQALPAARHVTSVEIDPVVAAAGLRYLSGGRTPEHEPKWSIEIDDAKHYIANLTGSVDVVALDIAGPFQRQVALLYTQEFYELIKRHLRPGGILSVPANGDFQEGPETASLIVTTLLSTFPDVFVVTRGNGRTSFAMAGTTLGFGKAELLKRMKAEGREDVVVYDRQDIQRHLQGRLIRPLSLANMDVVLKQGVDRLRRKFFKA